MFRFILHNYLLFQNLGTYSLGNAVSCTVCPEGSACAAPENASAPCTGGEYSPPGSTSCEDCPRGWECPNTKGSLNSQCPYVSLNNYFKPTMNPYT